MAFFETTKKDRICFCSRPPNQLAAQTNFLGISDVRSFSFFEKKSFFAAKLMLLKMYMQLSRRGLQAFFTLIIHFILRIYYMHKGIGNEFSKDR